MLPTFVIGLREGLEAALIVGIVAAFLRQQGRKDLLRWVYVGVGVAVLLCLAVGIAIKVASGNLPQRQQEGLETVVGLVAVAMVTYMVVWMKQHSRELKGQLEGMAAKAMDGHSGAGRAMVLMAFLAVMREGFETVVFLLAAFNESDHPATAAGGAILGIAVAVVLGYGIYRGGVSINLSKFFRATGLVLVLVAAGLVVSALHTAHEAGWVSFGQGSTVDLSGLVAPGSVHASLLTGMLGVQPKPVVLEVAGWLAYLIPVGLYVAWPPGNRRTTNRLAATLAAVGAAFAVGGVVLALLAPSAPQTGRATGVGTDAVQVVSLSGDTVVVRTAARNPAGGQTGAVADVHLSATGPATIGTLPVVTYTGTVDGTAAQSLPQELSVDRIIELNGGRLPIGLTPTGGSVPVTYTDQVAVTVSIEPRTHAVLDGSWDQSVRATLRDDAIGDVPLSRPVAEGRATLAPADTQAARLRTKTAISDLDRRHELTQWAWGLGFVALTTLLMAGVVLAGNRRQRDETVTSPSLDKPLVHS